MPAAQTMTRTETDKEYFFIVFSDDWGEHPSSCQHLFKIIGKKHTVLWVNTIGMRSMKLSLQDLKKAYRKLRKIFSGAQKNSGGEILTPERLQVIQPFMLPFVRSKLARNFNKKSVVNAIKSHILSQSSRQPVIITTVPNACDYVTKLRSKKIIYYCVDDFTHWPGLEHNLVLEMENKLITEADIFIATSAKLYEKLTTTGKPTYLLTHGVDVENFSNLPADEHPLLQNIPKPRVGYFGLFDERSDQELLFQTAKSLPDISFILTGNRVTTTSRIEELPNIYFTGPVRYKELPAMVAGWDICMLPYKIDVLTESINPLKLKEYLATGKPIISTPLNEVFDFAPYINIESDHSSWTKRIRNIVGGKEITPRMRSKEIKRHSWTTKAERIIAIASAKSNVLSEED